jgi:hypothetical protein
VNIITYSYSYEFLSLILAFFERINSKISSLKSFFNAIICSIALIDSCVLMLIMMLRRFFFLIFFFFLEFLIVTLSFLRLMLMFCDELWFWRMRGEIAAVI